MMNVGTQFMIESLNQQMDANRSISNQLQSVVSLGSSMISTFTEHNTNDPVGKKKPGQASHRKTGGVTDSSHGVTNPKPRDFLEV